MTMEHIYTFIKHEKMSRIPVGLSLSITANSIKFL